MPDIDYHQMYSRLVDEVTSIYQANQKRIHKGLWGMIIVLVLYLTLLFVTQGSKVIILLLWIMTMFALAAYLITIEYLNDELKKSSSISPRLSRTSAPRKPMYWPWKILRSCAASSNLPVSRRCHRQQARNGDQGRL